MCAWQAGAFELVVSPGLLAGNLTVLAGRMPVRTPAELLAELLAELAVPGEPPRRRRSRVAGEGA